MYSQKLCEIARVQEGNLVVFSRYVSSLACCLRNVGCSICWTHRRNFRGGGGGGGGKYPPNIFLYLVTFFLMVPELKRDKEIRVMVGVKRCTYVL